MCLNDIGDSVRAGQQLQPGSRRDDVLDGYDVELRVVHAAWHRALFGYAEWFYPSVELSFLQCVWPDMSALFPWDAGFDEGVHRYQPSLWAPPEQERAGPWRAWWRASEWPGRDRTSGLVFVSKGVAEADRPVFGVMAFEDGDWAFLDGGRAEPDTMVLLHLHHVLELDPSLEELIALEPGTEAWREAPGAPWSVSAHSE